MLSVLKRIQVHFQTQHKMKHIYTFGFFDFFTEAEHVISNFTVTIHLEQLESLLITDKVRWVGGTFQSRKVFDTVTASCFKETTSLWCLALAVTLQFLPHRSLSLDMALILLLIFNLLGTQYLHSCSQCQINL